MGNYRKALEDYQELKKLDSADVIGNEVAINVAVCMFYLGMRPKPSLIKLNFCFLKHSIFRSKECMPSLRKSLKTYRTIR